MRSEGYGTCLFCLSKFILELQATKRLMSNIYQQLHRNTGSKNNVADFAETSAYEQYQWLHRNAGSKNNVADFAEMSNKFESEKLALSWCVCLYVVYARQPVVSYPGRFSFFSTANGLGKASQPAHPRAAPAWHASEPCSTTG